MASNQSGRSLTFSDLSEFDLIESAKNYIAEKEAEDLIRKSHAEQFEWLERTFSVTLRKDLSIWPAFIELTERRNLFVHTDGIVSSQYLSSCRKHGFIPEVKVGQRLGVDLAYLEQAHACLYEVGVKLGQVLYRKLFPKELKIADARLNDICYELIQDEKYNLAKTLLNFATGVLKKHASQHSRLLFTINYALAFKLSGDAQRCKTILDEVDWTAADDVFKLAVAVLRKEYGLACKLMLQIGPKHGWLTKNEYQEWPLFRDFRKSSEFRKCYKRIFHEEFRINAPKKEATEIPLANKENSLGKI